jgi:hypothetical protein
MARAYTRQDRPPSFRRADAARRHRLAGGDYYVAYLRAAIERHALAGRWSDWAYWDAINDVYHGLTRERVRALYDEADALINPCGATRLREEHLRCPAHGWLAEDGPSVSLTPDAYRNYIAASRGEVSVAKNVYVALNTGWFSCRSACYLAAGRPVVVQDTGFSRLIATGRGLHAFSDTDQAAEAIRAVGPDYAREACSARAVARADFDPTRPGQADR